MSHQLKNDQNHTPIIQFHSHPAKLVWRYDMLHVQYKTVSKTGVSILTDLCRNTNIAGARRVGFEVDDIAPCVVFGLAGLNNSLPWSDPLVGLRGVADVGSPSCEIVGVVLGRHRWVRLVMEVMTELN